MVRSHDVFRFPKVDGQRDALPAITVTHEHFAHDFAEQFAAAG